MELVFSVTQESNGGFLAECLSRRWESDQVLLDANPHAATISPYPTRSAGAPFSHG